MYLSVCATTALPCREESVRPNDDCDGEESRLPRCHNVQTGINWPNFSRRLLACPKDESTRFLQNDSKFLLDCLAWYCTTRYYWKKNCLSIKLWHAWVCSLSGQHTDDFSASCSIRFITRETFRELGRISQSRPVSPITPWVKLTIFKKKM
jgi:hypothetical protein